MNVLLVLGHPRTDSLCGALCAAYQEGARAAGANVETLVLADLAFDLHVRVESPERQPLEPDLELARKLIERAAPRCSGTGRAGHVRSRSADDRLLPGPAPAHGVIKGLLITTPPETGASFSATCDFEVAPAD